MTVSQVNRVMPLQYTRISKEDAWCGLLVLSDMQMIVVMGLAKWLFTSLGCTRTLITPLFVGEHLKLWTCDILTALYCNLMYVLCGAIVTSSCRLWCPCVLTIGSIKTCLFIENGLMQSMWKKAFWWQYQFSFDFYVERSASLHSFVAHVLGAKKEAIPLPSNPRHMLPLCCIFFYFSSFLFQGMWVLLHSTALKMS